MLYFSANILEDQQRATTLHVKMILELPDQDACSGQVSYVLDTEDIFRRAKRARQDDAANAQLRELRGARFTAWLQMRRAVMEAAAAQQQQMQAQQQAQPLQQGLQQALLQATAG